MRVWVRSESTATRAVLAGSRLAQEIGFSPAERQGISTAVSELARNIIKYAGAGEITLERIGTEGQAGIQITARDRGPGIPDIEAAMRDHFSSSGTLGLGLPGVRRLMDDFEIDSKPGMGTRVVIRKWRGGSSGKHRSVVEARKTSPSLASGEKKRDEGSQPREGAHSDTVVDCGFFVRPCRGERLSGDAVLIERRGERVFIGIVDALGHGPSAHAIASRAIQFLKQRWESDLEATMLGLHEALQTTDGAAAGLCIVEVGRGAARYVGIGNTLIRTFGGNGKSAFSAPGTLGHQIRSPRQQQLSIENGDLLVLYTDGIKEQFELEDYPQLRYEGAPRIARTIVTRYGKDYDDASCVVVRYGG